VAGAAALRLSTDPVFLVGAARSGTSLLYRVLALHPAATYLSNWVQRFPQLPELVALNRLARAMPQTRHRMWFGPKGDEAYVYGERRSAFRRAFPNPAEAEGFYRQSGVPENGHDAPTLSRAASEELRRRVRRVARADGHRALLMKRIANNRRLPLLAELFPGARFIEIVRDGRAVAASIARVDWWEGSTVWWWGGTPADWRAAGRDPWELCARNWTEEVAITRTGLAGLDADRVLSIRYEDLVAAPDSVVRTCAAFAGMSPTDTKWTSALSDVRFPDNNQRWRSALPTDALTTIERVQAAELQRYGYLLAS